MTCLRFHASAVALLLLGFMGGMVGTGCSLVSDGGTVSNEEGGLLRTSQNRYDAHVKTDGQERVVVTIPYETRNPTSETLHLIGCRRPSPPVLERYSGGEWETAYTPVVPLCESPPWHIPPGSVRRDTFRVDGARPGQNVAPTFEGEIVGTYRLRRQIYTELRGEDERTGEAPLPLSKRVSNSFQLE